MGTSERQANTASQTTDDQETASEEEVSCCSVVPPWIATNDGGATPADGRTEGAPSAQLNANWVVSSKIPETQLNPSEPSGAL